MKTLAQRNDVQIDVHTFFQPKENDVYTKIPVAYARWAYTPDETITVTPPVAPDGITLSTRAASTTVTRTKKTLSFSVPSPGAYFLHCPTWRMCLFCDEKPFSPPAVDDSTVFAPENVDDTGTAICTEALQNTIDRAAPKSGTAYIPPGIYHTGTLFLRDNMTLYIDEKAYIKGSINANDYPQRSEKINDTYPSSLNPNTTGSLLICDGVRNVSITGRGIIDGQGDTIRTTIEGRQRNLNLLRIRNSSNIHVEGVALCNPWFWNTHILRSEKCIFRNLPVLNEIPPREWSVPSKGKPMAWNNTDGINPDASRNICIENVFAYCGDDCVPVKATNSSLEMPDACENITVRNCMFYTPCTAIKIGTETCAKVMQDMIFEDITIIDAGCAIGMFVRDNAQINAIQLKNIKVENCIRPLLIDSQPRTDDQTEHTSMRSLLFSHCNFMRVKEPFELLGYDKDHTIRNVIIDTVEINGEKMDEQSSHFACNEHVENIIWR